MSRSRTPSDAIANALAANRLGVGAIVFFVMSAAAPLTVVAGVVPTGFAATGLLGLPIAFLVVGIVLALFAVGYVAMARQLTNAGAFYAYISRGLGRPAGVGGSWVALIAYNSLQCGAYGAFGAFGGPLVQKYLGVELPWWVLALLMWGLVGVLGVLRVDLNGRVLAILLTLEIAIVLIFDVADLVSPGPEGVSGAALSPDALFAGGVGALLVIAMTGFVGFESSVVFSEESRDPRRTVPTATFVSIAIIAGLYALSSWAMTVAAGPGNIVEMARKDPELPFTLAAERLGGTIADIAAVLLLTSLIAASISFHNTIARYAFALGRERVLPRAFGTTSVRTGAPKVGSIAQTVVGFVVIALYTVMGWDPLVNLFFYGGTFGGFGVLLLTTATSLSVLLFFARNPSGESAWRRVIAPILASAILMVFAVLATANFATLLNVPETHPLRWGLPIAYVVAFILGLVWALILRSSSPGVYASIGLGPQAASAQAGAAPVPPAGVKL
ncbi:APC family permease [Bailinhaonella thermotolerans]|uniref:APC family permease n=1 Tax=Bailinhaonella thermotolerans TaxID=1070861 RepID=A0A3A4AAG7_9ACTN|nr:APC family permease [Bailinhaonella thermotolerans]RJL23040.1 APC family permease [Bailinhaonella thermotolerans]